MQVNIHDIIHHPLGGASYLFKETLIEYILSAHNKNNIVISIGAQPNSSPHLGTICVISLAFSLGKKIKETRPNVNISILFELIDTAPAETIYIDNVKYQKNLRNTAIMKEALADFIEILNYYSNTTHIPFSIRSQDTFNAQTDVAEVVKKIVDMRDILVPRLDPAKALLRIRTACPVCGLVDKEGINNHFSKNYQLTSRCPIHGPYTINLLSETHLLSFNTPLRNLVRAIVYSKKNTDPSCDYQIMRITGNEYAGFYQEETLYKTAAILGYPIEAFPMILYCPMITDWSGAKLSKSLYVEENAYSDLPTFLQNYALHKKVYGLDVIKFIMSITNEWIDHPYMLFRNYSIFYFEKRFLDER